jgi:hypothetical protein
MALKKDYIFKGITIKDCYIKICTFSGDKTNMFVSVGYYAEKENEKIENKNFSFAYDLAGENPIKQAYEHLKTLPEFAGAIDC